MGGNCTYPNTNGSVAVIVDEHDQPGMFNSIDQIEYPQGALIPVLKGSQTSTKYHVATIFVDHFSKLTYVHFSEITPAHKAVEEIHAFETYAATFAYKFKSTMQTMVPSILVILKERIIAANKTISFSGVNAHHQNEITERMIKTVTYHYQSMILNIMICWTGVITTECGY